MKSTMTSFIHTRTLESLCQELVEQGLLKQANNVRLQDYLGKILSAVCVNWSAIIKNSLCVYDCNRMENLNSIGITI